MIIIFINNLYIFLMITRREILIGYWKNIISKSRHRNNNKFFYIQDDLKYNPWYMISHWS